MFVSFRIVTESVDPLNQKPAFFDCSNMAQSNDEVVKMLAKMVDERLTVEFQKRDQAILDLKKGMDTLVQSLRDGASPRHRRIANGSKSARGARPIGEGNRLSPRPPGAQTARSLQGSNGEMLMLPSKPGEGGRSPISETPWGARKKITKKAKKNASKKNRKVFGSQAHPVRSTYKQLPDVNFGYAERDGRGRLEYFPQKIGGVPRVGMIYKDRRMAACKQRAKEYMSADRKYDDLSIEKQDYPECRSTCFRPTNYDESKIDLSEPDSRLDLEFVYGYSGWCPTVGGDTHGDQNIFYLKNGELIYPASAVLVMYDKKTHTQRFYRDHDDDISGIAIHPNGVVVATGQVGHGPPINIWDSGAGTWSGTAENAELLAGGPPPWPPETIGQLHFHERCIRAMDFSRDGKLLMSVGGDDGHTIAIWNWAEGEIMATAKGHGGAVITAGFNPFQCRSIDEADWESDAHYTLMSCGTKHIKFWTLSLVPDPEFKTSGGGSMNPKASVADKIGTKPLPGKKQLDLVKKPPKKGLSGEITNRRKEKMKWFLEGDTGKFGKAKIEDVLCVTFVPAPDLEGYDPDYDLECLTLAGSVGGHIMAWVQNIIPPDSESDSDDDEEDQARSRITWWESKGNLLCMEKKAHPGGVLGLEWLDDLKRLCSSGKDCSVKIWKITINASAKAEFQMLAQLTPEQAIMHGHTPRSVTEGGEFAPNKVVIGTTGNDILEIDVAETGDSLKVTTGEENRPMLPAHSGTMLGLACHPTLPRFATASEDKTVAIWDYDERYMISDHELPSKGQVACYSNDGKMVAIGMSEADFIVFTGADKDDGKLTKVAYKMAKPPAPKGPPKKRTAGAKETAALAEKMAKEKAAADLKNRTQKNFKANEEVSDIRFSPDDHLLAVASRDNWIYIYDVKKNFRRIGICKGHSSYITHIDWSQEKWMLNPDGDGSNFNKFCIVRDGVVHKYEQDPYSKQYTWHRDDRLSPWKGHSSYILQSDAGDYEHLYWWCSPDGYTRKGRWEQFRDTADMCDTEWHSWTCTLGYPVMGIWPEYSDGTDVNSVDRSKSRTLLVTGEDTFDVTLHRFPCLRIGTWGEDDRAGAKGKANSGHMSHVMQARWTKRDEKVITSGGLDCCAFQWKHVDEETGEVALSLEDQYAATMNAAKPSAVPMDVQDADELEEEAESLLAESVPKTPNIPTGKTLPRDGEESAAPNGEEAPPDEEGNAAES